MIVRMAKVEIVGPKTLLDDVLSLVQERESVHIESECIGFVTDEDARKVSTITPDKDTVFERIFLEDLIDKINELMTFCPRASLRESYLNPAPIIDTLAQSIDKHIAECRDYAAKRDSLTQELAGLTRYSRFLEGVGDLLEHQHRTPNLDYIAMTLRDPESRLQVERLLNKATHGRMELFTEPLEDGSLAALVVVPKTDSESVRQMLEGSRMPEFKLPGAAKGETFYERLMALRNEIANVRANIAVVEKQLDRFVSRWGSIYQSALTWAYNRLGVIQAYFSVYSTNLCFFIYGWMPQERVIDLRTALQKKFADAVMLAEMEIHGHELDRVPVVLKNPTYFKPFELFTRILPMPSYASYDPTPFIGIFFPLFFGLILGDAGYGVLILTVCLLLIKFSAKKMVVDAAKVFAICSLYTILFGILYGEYFGDLGHFIGLKPLLINREKEIIPMMIFAISIGVAHILFGMVLNVIAHFRKKMRREAVATLLDIFVIIGVILLVLILFGYAPELGKRPVMIGLLILLPLMLAFGGFLAPLEVMKHLGNIISYARIMAIGLTSVLLASVANRMSGITGDIVIGIFAAVLIHALNIVLGVFSPTVHSLRLHYVEFFGKFMEHGGKAFAPLKKKKLDGNNAAHIDE